MLINKFFKKPPLFEFKLNYCNIMFVVKQQQKH